MLKIFVLIFSTYFYLISFLYGAESTIYYQRENSINLATAWQRTLAYSPSLDVAEIEVGIKDAEKRQASLRPNPIADIEVENIGALVNTKGGMLLR